MPGSSGCPPLVRNGRRGFSPSVQTQLSRPFVPWLRSPKRDRRGVLRRARREFSMRKKMGLAVFLAALAALVLPAVAGAASLTEVAGTVEEKASELNMVWVAVATALVFLMQAG